MRRWVSNIAIPLALIDRRYYPTLLISALCVAGQFADFAFGEGHPWWHCLLYHFDHANIFHIALNLWGLYAFRPRWKTCAVAYVVASLCALLPITRAALPTCGLSGFLMAAYARGYAARRAPIWRPIAVNMAFVFLPMFNWRIHLVSFLISYLAWYRKRK